MTTAMIASVAVTCVVFGLAGVVAVRDLRAVFRLERESAATDERTLQSLRNAVTHDAAMFGRATDRKG